MKQRLDARSITWIDVVASLAFALLWVAFVRPGPLSLPYFWDEADVYVPGAKWLAENGFNITPSHFPDDYSRGHPPLLYLLAGIAFSVFGPEPAIGHAVVLPFAVLALSATYLLGTQLFGRLTGLAAAAFLAATPLFMSIGNMLLPEVPMTALSALALLAFARGRLDLVVLCGVALVWMKETGLATPAAITLAIAYDAWKRNELRSPATRRRILFSLIPVGALAAFFLFQRATAGYFIFPHHQNLFAERPFGFENVTTVFPSMLLWHGRWILVLVALFCAVLRFRRSDPWIRETVQPPASRYRPMSRSVVVACLLIVAENAVFFTKMFWLERYVLPAHPGLLVVLAGLVFGRGLSLRFINALPAIALVVLGFRGLWVPGSAEEHTFVYADVVRTHELASGAIEELTAVDDPILTTWPMQVELRQPYLGYIERPRRTIHPDDYADQILAGILVDERSRRADEMRRIARERGLTRSERFRVGASPALEFYTHPPEASSQAAR